MLRNLSWPRASTTTSKVPSVLRFEDFQFDYGAPTEPKRFPKGNPPTSVRLKRHVPRFQSVALLSLVFAFGLLGFAPVRDVNRLEDSVQAVGLGFSGDSTNRRLANYPHVRPAVEATQKNPDQTGRESRGHGVLVEVTHPGLYSSVDMALDLSLWEPYGVVYNDPDNPLGPYARSINSTISPGPARNKVRTSTST